MCFTYYLNLCIASLLFVSNAGLAAPGKGKARIRESLAATICSSMKTYSQTKQVVGLLETPGQFSVAAGPKSEGTICRDVIWRACNNCPKFNYISCKYHEEILSGMASRKSSRIVNGRDAYPNEFPFIVTLVGKKVGHGCGASIYNKNWVIIVAHCAEFVEGNGFQEYSIIGGEHIHSIVKATEQKVNIKSVVIHEGRGRDLLHDMALIQVIPPFEFNSAVAPITLLSKTYELKVGQQVRAIGWGKLGTNNTTADTLQTVQLKVISNGECQDILAHNFHNATESQVCALSESSNPSGICGGDSGGPLTMDKEDGLQYLVGVVSGTRKSDCGGLTSPSFFSRITYYYDWIVAHAI